MWKFIGTVLTNSSRDWRYSRTSKAKYFRFKPQFIEDKPVEKNEQLSYIYPIDLVDAFAENFSNESIHKRY